MGTSFLAGLAAMAALPAYAQDDADQVETVTVTGYRASLQDSTNAKRAAVNFQDSIFAEDIGKFPDTNIAESFNRVPGVTISRDIDGEGFDVQIRGLGPQFTKVLLNGAQVMMGSTGTTDSQGQNRTVDLNMLPTTLFTQLTVDKTARADELEGGAAGTINMRQARPFDNPGAHLTYDLGGMDNDNSGEVGPRGTIIASDTWGPFGVLVGATGQINNQFTTGYETIGYSSLKMSAAQCQSGTLASSTGTGAAFAPTASGACNLNGGGNTSVYATVPNGVSVPGLTAGQVIDAATLASLNPNVATTASTATFGTAPNTSTYNVATNQMLSDALIPRLGRSMYEKGTRSIYNGIVSLEYRPTDDMHFYLDMIGGVLDNNLDRSDMDWSARNGSVIPVGLSVDSNDVVTGGTFYGASFFLEARPYKEHEDFFSINPGMDWQITDLLHASLQVNASRSHFLRDSPTILVTTPTTDTVTYTNTGGVPTLGSSIDLDDPSQFQWAGGRVNVQSEKRYVYTDGLHGDVQYGGDELNVKVGIAYDEAYRSIVGYDNSQAWQDAVCGDGPSETLPSPNSHPSCSGLDITGTQTPGTSIGGGLPAYPGYGTNYSAGFPPLTWSGSAVPTSQLAQYLHPGPAGFIAVDYPAFEKATNYASYDYPNAPPGTGTNTGAASGTFDDKDWGGYAELNGVWNIGGRDLHFNAGLRWVETHETISGPVTLTDTRNLTTVPTPLDGGEYPGSYQTTATTHHTYQSFLPAINAVYDVTDDFQVRAAISRTMTRPDPSAMLPGVSFGDPSARQASIGNPDLAPYYSNNIDIGANLFTGGEGYIGFTAFRKSISGFTITGTTSEPFSFLSQYGITYATLNPTQQAAIGSAANADSWTITVQEQVNASGLLTVNGLEFDWVQPLDFLTEPYLGIKGFGINANATIVDQKGSGAAPAIATGVAPYTYNVTGYYENHGASIRLSYNFTDTMYTSGSNQNGYCLPHNAAGCPGGAYLFAAPYGELDLSTSYKLAGLFGEIPSDPELTFDIQNLTKSKLKSYFQYPSAPFTYYDQGSTYLFSIRGTF